MTNTNIQVTEAQQDIIKVNNFEHRAIALVIDSNETAQQAAVDNTELAKRIDMVKAVYADLIAPAKLMVENAKKYCDPALIDYQNARNITKTKLAEWDAKEQRRVAVDQEKADEIERAIRQSAEKKTAEILAKADAKIAAERKIAAEAAERVSYAKKAGDLLAQQRAAKEQAAAEAKAKKAGENADAKAAEIQAGAAARISAKDPVETKLKIVGSSMRDKWVAELAEGESENTAKMMLIKAICKDSPEYAALLTIDMKAVNKLASALHESFNVPAFKAVNRPVAVGTRK
jgi:hypothetical protein